MHVKQVRWSDEAGWSQEPAQWDAQGAQVVFVFGAVRLLRRAALLDELRARSPRALLFGCSTAGEILGDEVRDETLAVSLVTFAHTCVTMRAVNVGPGVACRVAGAELGHAIPPEGLRHVIVLCDGVMVNGSELVRGLRMTLPEGTVVTGGLAADGDRFGETLVLAGERVESGLAVALALYGERLRVGCGSMGGWDQFGPERRITRSAGNVLYEMDGKSALALYREYLGEHASSLPASGLLYPLAIRAEEDAQPLVRTILRVNEEAQSLTFAGDIPEGWYARLMRANFDRLVDGALDAARAGVTEGEEAELALLISCVGRKLILRQRVEEEVEAVREVLGPGTAMTGFYSYGEMAPFKTGARCELHNQTMTITTLGEG